MFWYDGDKAFEEGIADLKINGVKVVRLDHKTHVMATMKWTDEWLNENVQRGNTEFLFIIEKEPSEVFEAVSEHRQERLVFAFEG